jgi:hypothetical protein
MTFPLTRTTHASRQLRTVLDCSFSYCYVNRLRTDVSRPISAACATTFIYQQRATLWQRRALGTY